MQIRLSPYEPSYDAALDAIDAPSAEVLRENKDVYPDTVHVAFRKGKCLGFGYLAAGTLNYGVFSVSCDFSVDFHDPHSPDTAEALLEALIADFHRVRPRIPFEKVYLTVYAKKDSAVGGFVEDFGFVPERMMTVMRNRRIGKVKEEIVRTVPVALADGEKAEAVFGEVNVQDPRKMEAYNLANGQGFGHPESRNGLLFRVKHWQAKVYAWTCRDRVLAAVTVWPKGKGVLATEDIFCVPEFRRQKLVTILLRNVLTVGAQEGYEEAVLNVFSVNTAAVSLYEKCGYEKEYDLAEYRIV